MVTLGALLHPFYLQIEQSDVRAPTLEGKCDLII